MCTVISGAMRTDNLRPCPELEKRIFLMYLGKILRNYIKSELEDTNIPNRFFPSNIFCSTLNKEFRNKINLPGIYCLKSFSLINWPLGPFSQHVAMVFLGGLENVHSALEFL